MAEEEKGRNAKEEGRRKERRQGAREKRDERSWLPPCISGHISGRPLQDNGFSRGPIKIIQMTRPAVNSCPRASLSPFLLPRSLLSFSEAT